VKSNYLAVIPFHLVLKEMDVMSGHHLVKMQLISDSNSIFWLCNYRHSGAMGIRNKITFEEVELFSHVCPGLINY